MQLKHWHSRSLVSLAGGGAAVHGRAGSGGKLFYGMVLMMLVVLLAGCNSVSSSGSGASGQVVHLTYALWDPNEQVVYQKSIDQFEKLHPNIKVTIAQTPWAQYWTKLDTTIAGNSAPDVFWDHAAYFPHLVSERALMNLTPYIQKDKLDTSVYYHGLLQDYQYQGNTYGLPKDWDTITLFYNKSIFQKLGLASPDNLTWNPTDGGSFLQLLQKLTLDNNGSNASQASFNAQSIKQYGFVSLDADQEEYMNYIAMNGGGFLDKPFGTHFIFNQPKAVEALQFLVNLSLKWHVSPPGSETDSNRSTIQEQLFESGKAAMIETGSWNINPIISGSSFPVGIAQLPAGPQGRISAFNGLADAISAKTQHPQEAWELFKWLASPESQQILASNRAVWPGIQSVAQSFADAWTKKGVDVSAFLKEAQGTTISYPITLGYSEAATKIQNIFDQMYLGQIPVQQATDTAVQQGNDALQSAANGA